MFINKSKAIKGYSNTEQSSSLSKNSYQVVENILVELERSMKIVSKLTEKDKVEENDIQMRNSSFSRACIAIYTLQTSLDFEKGGSLATKLFQVYEFCRKQLIKAFTKKVVNGINRAIKTLNEIISAWKEMVIKNATI